ncbi:MAG: PUA domain-containing protein [Candidatus Hodarchaeota archaeon]
MDKIKNFRKINKKEKKIIFDSIRDISPKFFPVFKEFEYNLFISVNELTSQEKPRKIFLVLDDIRKLLNNSNFENIICSAGLYLGFFKKGKFLLSLESLEFFHKHNTFSEFHRLLVNNKGERSILYGNDIIRSMILSAPYNFKKNDLILIVNENDELLALAQAKVDSENIQNLNPRSKIAYNLVDKGYYLRKKQ